MPLIDGVELAGADSEGVEAEAVGENVVAFVNVGDVAGVLSLLRLEGTGSGGTESLLAADEESTIIGIPAEVETFVDVFGDGYWW